jgi:hypothetical protein
MEAKKKEVIMLLYRVEKNGNNRYKVYDFVPNIKFSPRKADVRFETFSIERCEVWMEYQCGCGEYVYHRGMEEIRAKFGIESEVE